MAIAFRQITAHGSSSSLTTNSASFGSGTAAGSIIIVVAMVGATTTISISGGGSYTDSGMGLLQGASTSMRVGMFAAPTAGTTTITATFGAGGSVDSVMIWEVTGFTNPQIDKTHSFIDTSGNTAVNAGATGTLSSANEAAVAYAGSAALFGNISAAGSGWTFGQGSLTTGNTGDGNVSGIYDGGEHQVTASTGSISGQMTATQANTNIAVVMTVMDVAAGLPAGTTDPIQYDLSRGHRELASYPATNRTWTATLLPELVGQDRIYDGPGKVPTYDWQLPAQHVTDRRYPVENRSWVYHYLLQLRGQDTIHGARGQVDDYQWNNELPRGWRDQQLYPISLRTYLDWYNLVLIGKDRFPPGQYPDQNLMELPRGHRDAQLYPTSNRSWLSQGLNLSTLGVPAAPPGENIFDLPPFGYARREQTWTQNLLLTTLTPLPPGENIFDLPPRGASYPTDLRSFLAWNIVLGNVALLPVPLVMGLAEAAFYPPDLRTWAFGSPLSLLTPVLLPPGEVLFDLPPAAARPGQTWLLNLLESTLSVPAVPVGEQVFDLVSRAPFRPEQTWLWQYNPNLVGRDALPVGETVSDLAPRAYPRLEQTWLVNLQQTTLAPFVALPPGENIFDLPPRLPAFQNDLRTWALNWVAIGTYLSQPLPFLWHWPAGPAYPNDLRTWTFGAPTALLPPVVLPPGENIYALPFGPRFAAPSWTTSFNLNLIGRDALPIGESIYETPRAPAAPGRTWLLNLLQSTLSIIALPPGENVFDLPPQPPTRREYTWAASYNLNLIARDVLPIGESVFDLSPRRYPPIEQTWLLNLQQTTLAVPALPPGESIFDLPMRAYPRREQTWTWWYPLELIAQDALPVGENIYQTPAQPFRQPDLRTWISFANINFYGLNPNIFFYPMHVPSGPPPLTPSWTWWYNLNLIGQDRLPNRQQDWPLPTPPRRGRDIDTWVAFANVAFFPVNPFAQYDWPVPVPRARQPDLTSWSARFPLTLIGQDALAPGKQFSELYPPPKPRDPTLTTWAVTFNPNLSGQDRFPPGENIFELPQRPYPFPPYLRAWTFAFPVTLLGQDQLPVGENVTDLTPRPYPYSNQLRVWASSFPLELIARDAMTVGDQFTDLPPPPKPRDPTLVSWTVSTVHRLFLVPFHQTEWPVPTPPWRPLSLRSHIDPLKLDLIGQDRIYGGPGEVPSYDWPLPKRYPPLVPYYTPQLFPLTFVVLQAPPIQCKTTVSAFGAGTAVAGAITASTVVTALGATTKLTGGDP